MYRYLGIIWNSRNLESVRTMQTFRTLLTSQPADWPIAYEGTGVLVIHSGIRQDGSEACALKDGKGMILGKLFDRHHDDYRRPHSVQFAESETRKCVDSGGQHIVDNYWGSYVAFLYDESKSVHHIFRDPMASMPCYHTKYQGVDIFFSDIADCIRLLPLSFVVNRSFLTRWLITPVLSTRETGLEGVEELSIGERLTLHDGHVSHCQLWNPMEIARTPRFQGVDDAAIALRSTVQSTINAWASCYQRITHKLSGGLDSSIVAGCLAQVPSKPEVNYLNFSLDIGFNQEHAHYQSGVDKQTAQKIRAITGTGDERYFARMVAERWKKPLLEKCISTSTDLSRMWQAPLKTRPLWYAVGAYIDNFEIELVRNGGTQAFFSGEGGDAVFLATKQSIAPIDYAYLHGLTPELWRHLVDACRLSKESFLTVLGKTLRRGLLRRSDLPKVSIAEERTLLREEATATLTRADFESPIVALTSRSILPPGKWKHATNADGAAYYHFESHSNRYADHIHPLNSQPIWELMLQVPVYSALCGGTSRGLARRAFTELLPAETRNRQTKGTGSPFAHREVLRNRDFLLEHLRDGLLVQNGYLDRRKLADCLSTRESLLLVNPGHIIGCLAAEIWLQQWEHARQRQLQETVHRTIATVAP